MFKKIVYLLLFSLVLSGQILVFADVVKTDDLIVPGGTCVGFDCSNGEDFSASDWFPQTTLRLKENNLRILFQDTSEAGSASQDWWMMANDTASGGANIFAVGDEEMPQTAMQIEFSEYAATQLANSYFNYGVPDLYAIHDGAGNISCVDASQSGLPSVDCPAEYTVTTNRPEMQDFSVDPSNDSFHITNEAVLVSRENYKRRLSNVEDGVDDQDVITVAQLNDVETKLAGVNALANGITEDMAAMDGRLNGANVLIQENRTDIESLQNVADSYMVSSEAPAAEATGEGSTAFGGGASARTLDTAIGANANVTADGSVAVGADTLVESQNSVAVGADSQVASGADGGVALGQNARVISGASGAVAVGQSSVATEANAVSVGSMSNQRRITNVAAGVSGNDAAIVAQLQAFVANSDISNLLKRLDGIDERADDVGALTTAFSALIPNSHSQSRTQVSLGLGHYSGSNAVAAGVFHYLSDSVILNAGISSAFNSNATAVQTGLAWAW